MRSFIWVFPGLAIMAHGVEAPSPVTGVSIRGSGAVNFAQFDTEDPIKVGQTDVYVIEIRNEGTGPCTNLKLVTQIPHELTFDSAQGPSKHRFEEGWLLFESVPKLEPGEKIVYRVTCKAVKPGCAKHAATLRFDEFDKPLTVEEGTVVLK